MAQDFRTVRHIHRCKWCGFRVYIGKPGIRALDILKGHIESEHYDDWYREVLNQLDKYFLLEQGHDIGSSNVSGMCLDCGDKMSYVSAGYLVTHILRTHMVPRMIPENIITLEVQYLGGMTERPNTANRLMTLNDDARWQPRIGTW